MSQINVSRPAWVAELEDLLARAAQLSVRHGMSSDELMSAAWNACLAANPGLRDELLDKELRAQLKRLRRQGLLGQA
jgi:hypothetical protein